MSRSRSILPTFRGAGGADNVVGEISAILAAGLLRLARSQPVPTQSPTPVNLENPPESASNRLEVGSEMRLHGPRG